MTAYQTKKHTRSTSAVFFEHIISLFDTALTTSIILGLQNKLGTTVTLMDFIGIPPDELALLEYTKDKSFHALSRGEIRLAKNIQNWVMFEIRTRPDIDFGTLDMEDFDAFQLSNAHSTGSPTQTTPAQPAGTLYQNMPTSIPMTPGFNPMVYMNPSPAPTTSSPSFLPSVKVDVKQYPVFSGENAAWSKFKRGVISLASTHDLEEIFDVNTIVPSIGDHDYQMFQEKNKFVYSMWILRITSGLALSILRDFEDAKDGRGVYLKLLNIYECRSNMKQVALMALQK
jgi:hypothetical protein